MIPLPIAGIAVTGSALLSKYAAARKAGKPAEFLRFNPGPLHLPASIKLPDLTAQLQNAIDGLQANVREGLKTNLIEGLASKVTQLTKNFTGEDYNKAVRDFIPADAELIKPRHLSNTGELGLADIDGDKKEELIASYRNGAGVGTIVLKKYNDQWFKEGELVIPGYKSINFRDTSDLTGSGRQQLLIGLPSNDGKQTLHAYEMEGGAFKKLFERSCTKFELLGGKRAGADPAGRNQLAFWDKESDGSYGIELAHWNGIGLEAIKDKSRYYEKRVLPMQVQQVRRNPYSPIMWYNFANVLAESGYSEDALTAVRTGMDLDRDSAYTVKFAELKKRLE